MAAIIDIWTPLERWLNPQMRKGESSYCDVYCMLRPGVTLAQAKVELQSISADLAKLYPDTNRGYEMVCFFTRADSMRARQVLSSIILLLAAMALAVACMNACTLLLARAAGRERETAVRIAVGAGRRHIFRLLLAEGLLLSTLAAALGIIITRFLLMATPVLMPPSIPLTWKLDLDLKVLAYTALLAIGTTFIFALTPAKLTYKLSVVGALKADMVGNRGKRRFSSFTLLIIAQMIETSGKAPQQLASEFRKLFSYAKPRLWIASISTLKEHVRVANYGVELVAMFVSALGLFTLTLASVGLAGLAHYWVRHHKREIGIRLSLGSTPGGIIRHMELRALRPVLAGMLIGMAIAIILERVISSMIFGVASFDIAGLAGIALFTFGVAAVATLIPTCQSGWVDPNSTLRQE